MNSINNINFDPNIKNYKKRSPSPFPEKPTKKLETNSKIRWRVKITFDSNYTEQNNHEASLNPQLFNEIFGTKSTNICYIKVSNLILKAKSDVNVNPGTIDLNPLNYEQVIDSHFSTKQKEIWITPFNKNVDPCRDINKMVVRIRPYGIINSISMSIPLNPKILLIDQMDKLFKKKFINDVLIIAQVLFINHPVHGPLKIVLENWEQNLTKKQVSTHYGIITKKTELIFKAEKKTQLVIAKEILSKNIKHIFFKISNAEENSQLFLPDPSNPSSSWKRGIAPLPLSIPYYTLLYKIKTIFSNKMLKVGDKEKISHKNWIFEVKIEEISLNSKPLKDDNLKWDIHVVNVFQLQENAQVSINGGNKILLTDSEITRKARAVTFKIKEWSKAAELKKNQFHYVNIEHIANAVKQAINVAALKENIVIAINDCTYLLKLKSADGEERKQIIGSGIHDLWSIEKETRIHAFTRKELKIVNQPAPYELTNIKLKIINTKKDNDDFISIYLEESNAEEKILINKTELEKIFREGLDQNGLVYEKQIIQAITFKGKKLFFKVNEVNTKEKISDTRYESIYKILSDTTIEFENDSTTSVTITSEPGLVNCINVHQKLLELGIGGMGEDLKNFICKIMNFYKYRLHLSSLEMQAPRGLLLYGPPGTGKSLLARKTGEILGISNERTTFLTGAEVLNKWVGESEKHVRGLFEFARKEQKEFRSKSPLHLIIIDEIDAILGKRKSDSKSWETSIVSTFLAHLDGITHEQQDPLNNILVIGLTNRPDNIDEAVKREGRLSPQILIGPPDLNGRKEIFTIHTRKLQEKNLIDTSVNIANLAEMTKERTGAFIQKMVSSAVLYSIGRLSTNNVDPEEINNHPLAKVTMDDFKNAFLECNKKEKENQTYQSYYL